MLDHYTLKEALDSIEIEYTKLTRTARNTRDRETAYYRIKYILRVAPEAGNYWKTCPSKRLYRDRVRKIKEYDLSYAKQSQPARSTINANKILEDGINYDAPDHKGLYLIGETHFNPFTDEKFYAVKVGKSDRSIASRMSSYNTHNPMLWRIDYRKNPSMEQYYQEKLAKVAIARCSHNKEWYFVDRKTYLEICEKGFSYFS